MSPRAVQFDDDLPLEEPFGFGVVTYLQRLAVFAITALSAFGVLGLAFAVMRHPVVVSVVTALLSLMTLILLYADNAPHWAYPVFKLRELFGARTLGFGKARSPVELIHAYRSAVATKNLEELQVLSRACSEITLTPAKELEALGRQILSSSINWSLEAREGSLFRLKSHFSGGEPFKRAWLGALTELTGHSEVSFFNRSSNGLAFALEFRPEPEIFRAREEMTFGYFDHTSFWVAFYADQREAMRRLEPEVTQFSDDADRAFYELERFYDFVNLVSAYLLASNSEGNQPIVEMFRHWDFFRYWFRQTEFGGATGPTELFFVNHLAWAFQHEEKKLLELALQEVRKDHAIVQMVSPFIKIVV
jgi:hypothetical protein